MISKDNERFTATISKKQGEQLVKYCRRNNLTKSAVVSLALATLFASGLRAGDVIGQMFIDFANLKGGKDE